MDISKKAIARQVADKYPTDRKAAIEEYVKHTDQYADNMGKEQMVIFEQELLSLLPPYRIPMYDDFAEIIWFIDPNGINMNSSIITDPLFYPSLKNEIRNKELLKTVKKYIHTKESETIELNSLRFEVETLRNLLNSAQEIYDQNKQLRSDKRNALIAKHFGFSTGYVKKRINLQQLYKDYVFSLRHDGLEREEAVQEVQQKYGINSYDATLKLLLDYRQIFLENWEKANQGLLPKVKKQIRGMIPSRR